MWITFTLIAVVLWSLVNIADSYLVQRNKHVGHPVGSLVLFSSLFAIIVSFAIYFFLDKSLSIPLKSIWLLIVAGFCNLLWIVFYLYALVDEDVSNVIPWFLSAPFFAYILSYYILGESLLLNQIFGGLVVIFGGVILSIEKKSENNSSYKIKWKPIIYMSLASFLIALWGVLFKFVAQESGFWQSSFWEHVGLSVAGLFTLVFVKSYREGFRVLIRTAGAKILTINIFSETLTIAGNLLANYAILFVPVTLVYLVEISQPAVVFILGIICTVFFPRILKEDITKRVLVKKGIAIAIMTFGGILLLI